MVRKFECNDCHCVFDADDTQLVKCPQCGSDNVEYAAKRLPKWVVPVSFLGLALVGIACFLLLRETPAPDEQTDTDPDFSQAIANEPPRFEISDRVVDDEGLYAFRIQVVNAPREKFRFSVRDISTGAVIATSKDGSFSEIKASENAEGAYLIQLVATKEDTVLYEDRVDGFMKVERVDTKMTAEELQQLIDSRDQSLIGVGENKYLSPTCELRFHGLSENDDHPNNLADVLEKLDMEVWESAKVESIKYDDTKHISSISFRVKKNSFDF